MNYCFFCGKETRLETIYRTSLCPSCGKELKICLNCRFYDTLAANQCRESVNEPVLDKEKSNFCDFFSPSTKTPDRSGNSNSKNTKAKDQFNSLFGENE